MLHKQTAEGKKKKNTFRWVSHCVMKHWNKNKKKTVSCVKVGMNQLPRSQTHSFLQVQEAVTPITKICFWWLFTKPGKPDRIQMRQESVGNSWLRPHPPNTCPPQHKSSFYHHRGKNSRKNNDSLRISDASRKLETVFGEEKVWKNETSKNNNFK